MVHKFPYHALERGWYINFSTMLLMDDGTEISVPCSRGTVVHEFCYLALGMWYLNFSTCSREEVVHEY